MSGKSYVLENIIENYNIKDGEKIKSETIYEILKNTGITITCLKKCFGIPNNVYTKLRKGEECNFTCTLCTNFDEKRIRYNSKERKILKQYIKEKYLTSKDICEIKQHITDDIRLMKILNINAEKYIKIVNGKIKRIPNAIIDYRDKTEIRKDIIKEIKDKENITANEIENIQKKKGYTEYQIKEALNITTAQYRKLKNNKIHKIEIISQKEKIKTELLKIDIKNLTKYGDRDYSSEEITNICKEYGISITTFIKRVVGNKKNPLLTKRTLTSKNGKIYLGKQKQISNDLIQKIYLKQDKKIENLAKIIAQMYGRPNSFEDLKQEAYLRIIESGGKIETNLSYDENLIINVLMKSTKYYMFNYLIKNKSERSLIQRTANGEFDLLDIIEDNTYNPDYLIEYEKGLTMEDMIEAY